MEALLLLADGRFPGGGYAHSGGVESAVADGSVVDLRSLAEFITGRLTTVGFVEGWLAAAACRAAHEGDVARLAKLDDECQARILAAPLRAASESLGRGLRRSARVLWPAVGSIQARHHPVVLGAVSAAAGLTPVQAARLALHGAVMGPVSAAPKLISLDMADALTIVADLAEMVDRLAAEVAGLVESDAEGPVRSAPLIEDRALAHATWEVRLFAT